MKWLRKRDKRIRLLIVGLVLVAQLPLMARYVPAYGLARVVRECRSGIADALRETLS